MDVVDVLKAVRQEVSETHWCKGNYEAMYQLYGPEDTPLSEILPEWKDNPLYRIEGDPTIGEVFAFKVQHCLVGMVNFQIGVEVGRASSESTTFMEDEKKDVWIGTINALGLAIFDEAWNPETRTASTDRPDSDAIEGWNDRDSRTRDDILEAVDKAIDLFTVVG